MFFYSYSYISYSCSVRIKWLDFGILVTLRPLTQFLPKISAIKLQKSAKFCLIDNYFSDFFTDVQIQYRKIFKLGPECFFRKIK